MSKFSILDFFGFRKEEKLEAISIHFGVQRLKRGHYGRRFKPLTAAESDSAVMEKIASHHEFTVLDNYNSEQSTRRGFKRLLKKAGKRIQPNGILLLTFSGHGALVFNRHGIGEHAICLHDSFLMEDELIKYLNKIRIRVNILIVLDSCYAGGVIDKEVIDKLKSISRESKAISKGLPKELVENVLRKRRFFYRWIWRNIKGDEAENSIHSIKILAGSEDDQESWEEENKLGYFTSALQAIWNSGSYNQPYPDFMKVVKEKVIQDAPPVEQFPILRDKGKNNHCFNKSVPFMNHVPTTCED